jgi:hypothetical protein
MTDTEDSLLETYEHETARYDLLKKCEELAEKDGRYAVAFVLFDVVGQLVELKKSLSSLSSACSEIGGAIADVAAAIEAQHDDD